jgi:hypothetical protein
MDQHEQRWVMKFFFLQGMRYNAIYKELSGVLGEAVVRLATVGRWCECFKVDNFSLDEKQARTTAKRPCAGHIVWPISLCARLNRLSECKLFNAKFIGQDILSPSPDLHPEAG